MGYCYEGLGMLERACPFYEKALKLEPDYEEAHEALRRVEDLLGL
jgi:tetratricopeptide (TPR) repeat protein